MDKPLDPFPIFKHCVHHGLGPEDIGLKKQPVLIDRSSHMGFGRKMDDHIDLAHQIKHKPDVANIPMIKCESGTPFDPGGQVVETPGIGQGVQDKQLIFRGPFPQIIHKIAPQKTGSPGNQYPFLHGLPDLLNPINRNGLILEHLAEYIDERASLWLL